MEFLINCMQAETEVAILSDRIGKNNGNINFVTVEFSKLKLGEPSNQLALIALIGPIVSYWPSLALIGKNGPIYTDWPRFVLLDPA